MSETSPQKHQFPVLATILTLIGIAILASLGTWQLQRLAWKQTIISSIEAEQDKKAGAHKIQYKDLKSILGAPYPFKRGYIKGEFANAENSVLLSPRTSSAGEVGSHLVFAFYPENWNNPVLVNLGWVPGSNKTILQELGSKTARLNGQFRAVPDKNAFTPDNRPERGIWTHIDKSDLGDVWGIESFAPFIFYVEDLSVQNGVSNPPGYFSKDWKPRNKHLQYAIFWFSMTFILAVMYGLRFLWPYLKDKQKR